MFRALLETAKSWTWVRKSAWTLTDQASFAGANFVVNVLLARWLTPEGYGAYTVAYTAFLLIGTVHGGYFSEPMLVFGPDRFEKRLANYVRILLSGQLRFSFWAGILMILAALVAWGAGQNGLALALAALSVGQAAILFQRMMRAACYVRLQPHLSATTGMLYAGLVVTGAWAVYTLGILNEATAIGLMAGASLAAATVIAIRMGVPWKRVHDPVLVREAAERHRAYGGWAAGTGVLEWYNGYLPFLLLPLWAGLADTGGMRALYNLVLPVVHVFHAFSQLLIPVFVKARLSGVLRERALTIGLAVGGFGLAYTVVLEVIGAPLFSWLYAGTYDAYAGLLWTVALIPPALAASNITLALLRAQERPRAIFRARAGAAVLASTVGAWLIYATGVLGALLSNLLAVATEAALMARSIQTGGASVAPSLGPPAAPDPRRRRILLVAFACGPGRGSEPGQGWQFAHRLAQHHDVTALVYSGFRTTVERELAERPVPGLNVVYHRLPGEAARHWERGEDRIGLREQLHYHLWHLSAGGYARVLHSETPFDLVHHVSFMRYWSPSACASVPDVPFVWGPVGGGESAPDAFRDQFSTPGRWSNWLRNNARWVAHRSPSVLRTARRATVALATTEESATRMRALGAKDVRVLTASVALAPEEIDRLGALRGSSAALPVRFMAAGRLLHWKGYDLAMRAFARAAPSMPDATLWVLGEGPEGKGLAKLARQLGIADQVELMGHLPRAECLRLLGEADVFVHPSFHDSGGYATLEAMAARRPVICLRLGGPGLQVTEETGIAVEAATPEQTTHDLASAFERLAQDPALRRYMGEAGRARVQAQFTWSALIDDTLDIYDELLPPPPTVPEPERPRAVLAAV